MAEISKHLYLTREAVAALLKDCCANCIKDEETIYDELVQVFAQIIEALDNEMGKKI